MAQHYREADVSSVTTTLKRLSNGVDRILDRWPAADRPSKLQLLNDLAAAIKPGCNWGALKASMGTRVVSTISPQVHLQAKHDHAVLIPRPSTEAAVFPARPFPLAVKDDRVSIAQLSEDLRPLFSMTHGSDPIVGLVFDVYEGNGDTEVSIHPMLLVAGATGIQAVSAHPYDLAPEVARLAFSALHDMQKLDPYSAFGQSSCSVLHVLLGPFRVAVALPHAHRDTPSPKMPCLGARILFDEGAQPTARDLETSLHLASAFLGQVNVGKFPSSVEVQFALSLPRTDVWTSVDGDLPSDPDRGPWFRASPAEPWSDRYERAFGDDAGLNPHGLGEALDLSLALIDVDEPDVFLEVTVTPQPAKIRDGKELVDGWRGGIVEGWRILSRRRNGRVAALTLDEATAERLEKGLNGWAKHEGFLVSRRGAAGVAQALVLRDRRRAAHHLNEVRALMDSDS